MNRAYMKTKAFLDRQMSLALDAFRAAPDPVQEARRLLAKAVRMIERATPTHRAAARTGAILREILAPYFGPADAGIIGAQIGTR